MQMHKYVYTQIYKYKNTIKTSQQHSQNWTNTNTEIQKYTNRIVIFIETSDIPGTGQSQIRCAASCSQNLFAGYGLSVKRCTHGIGQKPSWSQII